MKSCDIAGCCHKMFKLPISCKPCESDGHDFAFDWNVENKFESHNGFKNNSLFAMRKHLSRSHNDDPSNYIFTTKNQILYSLLSAAISKNLQINISTNRYIIQYSE